MQAHYQQKADIAWRRIDDAVVLIDPDNQMIRQANEVAGEIWVCLSQPSTVDDVVAHVRDQFEVSEDDARTHVRAFLDALMERGLIEAIP